MEINFSKICDWAKRRGEVERESERNQRLAFEKGNFGLFKRSGNPAGLETVYDAQGMNRPKVIAGCALVALLALYLVGAVSNGVLRHAVQTLPLWFSIVLGFRERPLAKYTSIPCFVIWLVLMTFIWLFLLGWAKVISGHFTTTEVALTVVIGAACIAGLAAGFGWQTRLRWGQAVVTAAIFALLQLAALRLSFLPSIAKDR